jgi:hypothetical protein
VAEPLLRLAWRPFQFHLPQAMVTAHGALAQRRGWLLRLEAADGRLGWGEALALEPEQGSLASGLAGAIQAMAPCLSRPQIEAAIGAAPKPLAFALGAALCAIAGGMLGPLLSVQVGMGENILILAFVVIVIGGIGSIRGALMGALLVGFVDTAGRTLLPIALAWALPAQWASQAGPAVASVLIYVLMAAVLFWKPRGVFPARG